MESWLIWLIIGVVFLVVEMLNAGFGIVCLGIGAFLAAIIAALGLGLTWQLLGLVVGTFLSFIFIKPVINKWLDKNNDKKIDDVCRFVLKCIPHFSCVKIKSEMENCEQSDGE